MRVRETVPDTVFDKADEIVLVDFPPDELLKRLAEGKVYVQDTAARAVESFFKPQNLTALRELALRFTAERVDKQLREIREDRQISAIWRSGERLLVAVGASPFSTREAMHNMEKAEQFETTLVATFAPRENGAQQAIDAFAQHAAAPGRKYF